MAWKRGLRDTLVLTSTTSMVIARESAYFNGVETGGLLVGRKLPNDVFLVTMATSGGPNARRSVASFSPDIEYLNRRIEESERKGLEFIGEWHIHPGSLNSLSGGDHVTIREAMRDNQLNKFIALIVNLVGDDKTPQLHAYLFQGIEKVDRINCMVIDEREVDSVMPWFMTEDGKKRLLIESKSMSMSFPTLTLHKKEDTIFWAGDYKGHEIRLVYPTDYPDNPISIETIPHTNLLPHEPMCYYAALAAQVAYLRIDRELPEVLPREAIQRQISISSREPMSIREETEGQWYETKTGKQLLPDIQDQLKRAFAEVKTIRLQSGRIAFSCSIDEQGYQEILVVFPEDFPKNQPEAHAYVGGKEVAVEQLPVERWRDDPSVVNLARYIHSQMRENKQI